MTLDRYFRTSSYCLFAISFLMLVATRQLDWISPILYLGALMFGWEVDAGKSKWKISTTLTSWLMLIFLPFPVVDWLILRTNPIVALVHFIFFASAMKLIQAKRDRDWIWLYVVSFFQMLLAAGMMIDTSFFVLLVLFLFCAVSTLVSYEMRRAQLQSHETTTVEYWRETETAHTGLPKPRWRTLGYFSGITLALILLLATPLFLAMPRIALKNTGVGWMQGNSLSGFSDTVTLGEVGQLKLNPKLVMRVRVTQPPGQNSLLRWRGVTLDQYDGKSWRDSTSRTATGRALAIQVPRRGNTYWLDEGTSYNHTEALRYITRQTFYLEPLDTPTIFAASKPLWIEGLNSLWKDDSDGLWTSRHSMNRLIYVVESDTRTPQDEVLQKNDDRNYGSEITSRYLQIPRNFDRRVATLSAEITRNSKSVIESARLIEAHLRSKYSYSLNLRRSDESLDPIVDFLLNVRSGHCEYFASSMTLMLRTQGIPARIVNGFQTGEFTNISEFYTVRQSDAHSWVEIYFPDYGWLPFDPTPAAGLSTYEMNWASVLRQYSDAVEMFWLERVIGFGVEEQEAIAFRTQRLITDYQRETGAWFDNMKARLNAFIKALRGEKRLSDFDGISLLREILLHPIMLGIYSLGFAAFGFVLWRKNARSWQRRIKLDAQGSAIAFYQEMIDILESKGFHRAAEQTPKEFAQVLMIPAVSEITSIYQRVRFGQTTIDESEIAQVESALKELREIKKQANKSEE